MRIKIENLSKSYTPGKQVLRPLDLEIASGELFFLLGPSGCGKSTLLRLIAGFLTPDSGRISFDGKDVTHLPPEQRNAPMVFQNYALWPHLSVFENVAFGLKAQKLKTSQVRERAMEALEIVRMSEYAERKTPSLSGGQQQRVALARALAVAPELLLLDEPLSNLDAKLRDEMRDELRDICRARKLTAVYVTHDRREALSMADRMAVLENGAIAQLGTPEELYKHPANRFTASFLGEVNFIAGVVKDDGIVESDLGIFRNLNTANWQVNEAVELAIRPEVIAIDPAFECAWQSELTLSGGSYLGEIAAWKFDQLSVNEIAPGVRKSGSRCRLGVKADDVVILRKAENGAAQ
ncbi:MAG: ABC transporter ATP-binding protein [Lentisphaerae bacterium]|nr:ABC transporter ATP-binding protein [Lentisphaerota bacterium]